MDQMVSFEAILFPSDDRAPHLVSLMTSVQTGYSNTTSQSQPISSTTSQTTLAPNAKVPHPEMYMDYIAEGIGSRAWQYHVSLNPPTRPHHNREFNLANASQPVEALDGMNKKFTYPYLIFYPVVSRDGMPFPINKCIREIQAAAFKEEVAWRGNIVIAKYRDDRFSTMMDASMADFPLLKNYLSTSSCPFKVCSPTPSFLRSTCLTYILCLERFDVSIGRLVCLFFFLLAWTFNGV